MSANYKNKAIIGKISGIAFLMLLIFLLPLTASAGTSPDSIRPFYPSGDEAKEDYYLVTITNITGDREIDIDDIAVESPVWYQLRVQNNGVLNDAYTFTLDQGQSGWAELFLNPSGESIPVPLVIEPQEYADIYLKVTIPAGAPLGTVSEDIINLTGTWIYYSSTVTTTIINTLFYDDFGFCPDWMTGWMKYKLQGQEQQATWMCPEGGGYIYHTRTSSSNNTAEGWAVSPSIHVPEGCATLSFSSTWNADVPGYPQAAQSIYISSGHSDPTLYRDNYNKVTDVINNGDEMVWQTKEVDISQYAGMDIYVAFVWEGELAFQNWYITDITLESVLPTPMPFAESFDPGSDMPGWKIDQGQSDYIIWSVENSNFAGGEPRELKATGTGNKQFTGISRAYSPGLDIRGVGTVSIDFLYNISSSSNGNSIISKVQYSTDGTNWIDTSWSITLSTNNYSSGPQTANVLIDLLAPADTLFIAWVNDGDHRRLAAWYVDLIIIDTESMIYDYYVTLDNLTGDTSVEVGDTQYYQLRVKNTGSAEDTYSFDISGDWAVGLYADTSDTPLPDPLTILPGNTYDAYLKVTVPMGTPDQTVSSSTVEITGTGTPVATDSVSVTTTATQSVVPDQYTVTITVLDYLGNPLKDMNIWIWYNGNPSLVVFDQDTDASGQVSCTLPVGDYQFDIYDYYDAYEYYIGSFTLVDQNLAVPAVYLNLINFEVLYEVLDESGLPIGGAVIDITGADNPVPTDINGMTTAILSKGYYSYTVSSTCYEALTSSVSIGLYKNNSRNNMPKTDYHLIHHMTASPCKITFAVTDNSEPVMGARIVIDGVPGTVITSMDGVGETELVCGSYSYIVEAGNYNPYEGSFEVQGTKNTIDINLSYDHLYISPAISLNKPEYRGIWLWSYNPEGESPWTNILNGISAEKILAGDISGDGEPELIALLSEYGLWSYNISSNTWNVILNSSEINDFVILKASADKPSTVAVSIRGYGTYKLESGAWKRLIPISADIMTADNINRDPLGIDELFLSFTDYSGLYIYSFETETLSRIVSASPSHIAHADITNDGYNELVLTFDGYGVYLLGFTAEESDKSAVYPSFDILSDITANNHWVSKGSGLQLSRITWGTPDAGHDPGTGDIALGFGSEIVITYGGSAYYYSYDSLSWHPLLYAPLSRVISSRFTGNVRDDLIVCESISKSIYLYNTKANSWELILDKGDTDAMVPLK